MPRGRCTNDSVMKKRVFLLILDSVGCGAMPDAGLYGDEGSDTIGHTAEALGGLDLPAMQKLGIGNIHPIKGVAPSPSPAALWGRMAKKSPGKDTITGHWELAGHLVQEPFRVFPDGFPPELMEELERKTSVSFIGNRPASGTVIIEELGQEHMAAGRPIIYTSADSVIQIAAHEDVIALERLYEICEVAGEVGRKYNIARVIARPFVGKPGSLRRTYNRRDFSVLPGSKTMLDILTDNGIDVTGVGKIGDIFARRGVGKDLHTEGNDDGARVTLELARSDGTSGLVFVNFVDFDMLYGHRRNAEGYGRALEKIDLFVSDFIPLLRHGDLAFITADHGNDPTFAGTDHTHEYVPVLIFGPCVKEGRDIGTSDTFADVAETILQYFGLPPMGTGKAIPLKF